MTPRDPFVVAMSQLTKPLGESRDDFDIFAGIAREMGLEEAFSEGRSSSEWQRRIYDQTRAQAAAKGIHIPEYDTLLEKGWFKLDDPPEPVVMLKDFRNDPESNPLATPSGKIEIFSQTVASFNYDDCLGHPVWREPYEWLGNVGRYPLHLVSNQPKDKLHSQLDHGSVSRAGKIAGREPLHIHPEDAAARGVKPGDVVRAFNARGACLAGAVLNASLRRGVVQMSTGAWYDPDKSGLCKHGNPNVLTRDKGTSRLGQGPSAQSCLIEVELYDGVPPAVTAHAPPTILRRHSEDKEDQK